MARSGNETPRALYQVKSRGGGSSAPSGLEELAEVVHSSGLSGSGLANRTGRGMTYATPAQQKQSNRTTLVAIAAATAVCVLLVAAVFVFVTFRGQPETATARSATIATAAAPAFAGKIPLEIQKTVFVIDRGDATASYFDVLKRMVTRSVASLGGDRRFQVIAWENFSQDAYPRTGLAYANPDEVTRLQRWFDNVATGQATSVGSALSQALMSAPDAIVLITGKSDQLDASFAGEVLEKVRGKGVKIHTVTLGDSPAEDPLKKIALDTGGIFLHLTRADLAEIE